MRPKRAPVVLLLASLAPLSAAGGEALPKVPEGWKVELVAKAPAILYPTALVAGPDGSLYLGQDPMDMPGPPTRPIDSVVRIKDGKVTPFAEGLWAVMGLEWVDDALIVVHAPFLSAFRDTDGDGKADRRVDLMTGLGPSLPGFNGLNDHIASGIRLGMDGFLYISVGDKGIPKGVGRDGTTIQLFGGGVIRIRPDGTGLEVVSTGERNPLSVALSATDEVFTYGNDDDSKQWPNSLTHHIVGGHYGYPYQFLDHPERALPILNGQIGGSGTQGICYNEDGLPPRYRGNFFFCDWGRQTITRYVLERNGGTFRVASSEPFMDKGDVSDFRPFTLAPSADGASLYVVDWGFNGWLAAGPKTGRLYRLSYVGADAAKPAPRPTETDVASLIRALDHPARSVRLSAQRALTRAKAVEALNARLRVVDPRAGRLHAIWALSEIPEPTDRTMLRWLVADEDPDVRLQAIRSCGIRRDTTAARHIIPSLRHREARVRREAAIALGRIGGPGVADALLGVLSEPDEFAAWSIRRALRSVGVLSKIALSAALLDDDRREGALKLCDENWTIPVVEALADAIPRTEDPKFRARMVATLGGLARRYPAWSGRWYGTNPLVGDLPAKTEPWEPEGMAVVSSALRTAVDDADARVRIQAIVGLRGLG
ncbi:MAG TPA: HEAT repeat domain-containing protein, partial [Isosphaeraceae bacterium]|nr:HEAT repeat domain-containing protein [Isosphaeraceae bacterium]